MEYNAMNLHYVLMSEKCYYNKRKQKMIDKGDIEFIPTKSPKCHPTKLNF